MIISWRIPCDLSMKSKNKHMKIGILTLPLHTNYGGILQAYALQTTLKKMGHEVFLLNKDIFSLSLKDKFILNSKKLFKKIFLNKNEVLFLEDKRKEEYLILSENIRKFIDSCIENIITIKSYNEVPQIFDVIVVGSDQIWNSLYMNPIENGFLQFTKGWNIKRISYAASFGSENWLYTEKQTKNCNQLVQLFSSVSVREKSAIDLCQKYLNVQAVHVLDPTMLIPVNEYISIINKCEDKKEIEGGLFVYILEKSEQMKSYLKKVENILNYKPYYTSTDRRNADFIMRKTEKMESWLNSFYKAKFVVTDSFHACVFAILFHKPFCVLLNNNGNERIFSLLTMFNLKNRIINSVDDISLINRDIDWTEVNTILENERTTSKEFLLRSINL